MEQNRRVLVAMSGGVDSSAAVCLLKEQGYACVGVTMKLLGGPPGGEEDAREAARRMEIPHYVLDCAEQFRREVVQPFADAYERGETPNPCVFCNRALKFGLLLDKAEELGCAYLATGHYARITDGGGGWRLRKAADLSRDQSYVLYPIPRQRLGRVLFPLGGLSKDQVREIAARAGFPNARKQDSQDICFIPDGDYGAFLRRYTGKSYPAGDFLDENGGCLGRHGGIVDYTIGQRRGLGVSSSCGRLYVKEVRPADNTVVLSGNESLFRRSFLAASPNWIALEKLSGPLRLKAKVRYRMEEQPCVVEPVGEDLIRVCYDEPQRAITPGQSVVFYEDELVVGGAVIRRTEEA